MVSNNAFEAIFHEYYSPLCNYAAKIIGDFNFAEELVQDLFVQFLERDSLKKVEHLDRFLLRSVKFKCIDHLKKQNSTVLISLPESEEFSKSFQINQDEDMEALYIFLVAKLPQKTKEVFTLIREGDLSYKETADALSISVKTVENQMGRALKKMRAALKDLGYFNSLEIALLLKYFFRE
jgi:RNA polymerase sigma-70 factor, ECF subfamily